MGLTPNTKLGPYEVLLLLGAGGMGEVYRARDARLDREVAIKVLPEALARDKERAGGRGDFIGWHGQTKFARGVIGQPGSGGES